MRALLSEPMLAMEHVGEALGVLRRAAGISSNAAWGRVASVNPTQISRYQSGQPPELKTLLALLKPAHASMTQLERVTELLATGVPSEVILSACVRLGRGWLEGDYRPHEVLEVVTGTRGEK